MLTRLYTHNYKCLDNFELKPAATQLLMGRNGAGKSTVFDVLELLRDFAIRGDNCEDRFVGETRTRWQKTAEQRFEIDVTGNGGSYTYVLVVNSWLKPAALLVQKEHLSFDGKTLYAFEGGIVHLHNGRFEKLSEFSLLPRRSYLPEIESNPENSKLTWFKRWFDRLVRVQIDPRRMWSEAEREALYPSRDLANFAQWYRHLRQENSKATDCLRNSLTNVIDGFEGLDLKGPPDSTKKLEVRVVSNSEVGLTSRVDKSTSINSFDFDELSDGQRALVGLYALLHCAMVEHTTLCIDEPDNFIALGEIQPWLFQLIDRGEETGSQIFIASHHPELLNQLATRNGIIIERMNAGPARVMPFAPPADSTLTPAEMVARGWERQHA